MKNLENERKIERATISERKRIRELLINLPKNVQYGGSQYTSHVVVPLTDWSAIMEKIG